MSDRVAREAEVPRRAPNDAAAVADDLRALNLDGMPPLPQPPPPPPLPQISSNGIVNVDITEKFFASTSTMEPGKLIKDGYFTLFESLAALEIMDPKMDSGCLKDGESPDSDYDLKRPLEPEEVVGIIDQLLCLEMAWHLGYPLSQTLLISVYVNAIMIPQPKDYADADFVRGRSSDDLAKSPEHLVLRAYCLALIKTCWCVLSSIRTELFYEEEDFSTNTYNLSLLEQVHMDDVREALGLACATVDSNRSSSSSTDEQNNDKTQPWSTKVAAALGARLAFRTSFLQAMELAELRDGSQLDLLKQPWSHMKTAMEVIQKTADVGKPVPDAFSAKLQRKLPSTMPPRPIVQPSFDEASRQWIRLCDDGAEAMDVLHYVDPPSILNFVLTFQAKKPQPLVYIRTLLQALIFTDNIMLGSHSIRQILDDDLAIQVLPASLLIDPANDEIEVVHDPRFIIAQQMEEFRQRIFPGYLDMLRVLCQNRSRARRMLCHSIQEWEGIQVDAEDLDQILHKAQEDHAVLYGPKGPRDDQEAEERALALPLSSWAFLYKLRLMEWVVQLGFELEVYQPDELAGMYWFLCSLAKRRVQHLERIHAYTLRSLSAMRRTGHGPGFTPQQETAFKRSLAFLRTQMLDASVTWELADALSCLYTVLRRTGLVTAPSRPYGTDALRYELRMKPFATVGLPPLPTHAHFVQEVEQPGNATTAILGYAVAAVGGAKKGCDALAKASAEEAFAGTCHGPWVANIKKMHRTAILLGIAVATVRKGVDEAAEADAKTATATATAAEKTKGKSKNKSKGKGKAKAKETTAVENKETTGSSSTATATAATSPTKPNVVVQVPSPDKCYHEWWIVPKIMPAPSS